MNKSESIKELATALSKVKFGEIGKSKTVKVATKSGSSYNFDYAPLEVIMGAIRGPLAEQGLSLVQGIMNGTGLMVVETTLIHSSGEWMSFFSPVITKEGCTAQEMGSAITYARRYGVTLACCLVADEDDDANIADGNEVHKVSKAPGMLHKPTDGAWESMTPDMRIYLTDLSGETRGLLVKGDFHGAAEHINEQGLDNDQKTALWTRFDSKERSALKKAFEEIRLKETA